MPLKNAYIVTEDDKTFTVGQPGNNKTFKVAKTPGDPFYEALKVDYLKGKGRTQADTLGKQTEDHYNIERKDGKLGLMVPKPEAGETDPVLERLGRKETKEEKLSGMETTRQIMDPLAATAPGELDTARIPGQDPLATSTATLPLEGRTLNSPAPTIGTGPTLTSGQAQSELAKGTEGNGLADGADGPVSGTTVGAVKPKETTASQSSKTSVSPEATKDLEDLRSTKNDLAKSTFKALKVEQDLASAKDQVTLNETNEVLQQQEQQAIDFQVALDNSFRNYQRAVTEYSKMGLDSERLWKTPVDAEGKAVGKPKNNKLLAAIAVGMGTFGSHITGGENVAYRMIENLINQDIDEQKFNITRKGHEVALRRGAFADLMDKFKSDTVATGILKESKMRAVHQQMIDMHNKLPDDQKYAAVRAQSAKTIAGLEEKIASQSAENSKQVEVSSRQQVTQAAKEIMPPDMIKMVEPARKALSDIGDVKTLISSNKAETGIDEHIIQNLARKFGAEKEGQVDLNMLVERMAQEYKVEITGAGSSAKESDELRKAVPLLKDNPKAFLAKLQVLERKNREILQRAMQYLPKDKYHIPPELGGEAAGSQGTLDNKFEAQGQK